MSAFEMLLHGFSVAFTPANLLAACIGVILGTLTGVLPGLGISGAIALLLPISYSLDPLAALTIFAGIYYGAMYGGSTSSILINVPGEGASVVTCIEGYAMAKRGRAGAALAVAAIGSFLAGSIGLLALALVAPPLAEAALAFGPPEYFGVAVLGLVILSGVAGGSPLKSAIMVLFGIMLGTVGQDPSTGVPRFTYGLDELMKGINFVVVVMGAYGLGEVILTLSEPVREVVATKVRMRDLYPTRSEMSRAMPAIARGGVLGFFIGLIPGPSATISTFTSYAVERRVSRGRAEFGKGAIEGVAGPEAANNSAESATLIPLLSLGLPFNSSAAMLLAGFIVHGITPGPTLMVSYPDLFWGLVASMFIANLLLLVINLPFVGVFASLLKTPLNILMPIVAIIVVASGYVLENSFFDMWSVIIFGVIGLALRLARYELAPLVIGLFLGPLLERSLGQSMVILSGDPLALFSRPLSGTLLGLSLLIIATMIGGNILKLRGLRAKPSTILANKIPGSGTS